MKNRHLYFTSTLILALAIFSILMQSCAASRQARQLTYHQNALAKMAASNASPEEKMDLLATTYVQVMRETLNILNPEKAVQYATKFGEDNKTSIQALSRDISGWQKNMNTMETIGFGVKMVQKPYAGDLIDLIPKVKQKYNQLKFLYDIGVLTMLF